MALRYALLYAQTFYSIFGRNWRRPGANWTALQWADSFLDGGFVQNGDLAQEVGAAIAAGLIPVFTFWEIPPGDVDAPTIVRACIERYRAFASNLFRVFVVDRSAAPVPPGGWDRFWGSENSIAHIKDYVSFYLISTFGGIWLDASIILLRPLEAIFNVNLAKFQGWYQPGTDGGVAENWAFFAPPGCPIMKSWYLLTVLWLATDHQPEGAQPWFPYLWQHDIWREEMVPMIKDYGWQDLYILRDPAGIFVPYDSEVPFDLSIVSLLITNPNVLLRDWPGWPRNNVPMVKLTRFERDRLASSLHHGIPEVLLGTLQYHWVLPA